MTFPPAYLFLQHQHAVLFVSRSAPCRRWATCSCARSLSRAVSAAQASANSTVTAAALSEAARASTSSAVHRLRNACGSGWHLPRHWQHPNTEHPAACSAPAWSSFPIRHSLRLPAGKRIKVVMRLRPRYAGW